MRRRPGEAPATHRVWLSPDQPFREQPSADGKTYFRIRLDGEPSPEWMRAYRAGMLGLVAEDRDAVLRFEFQGDSVRFAAADAEVAEAAAGPREARRGGQRDPLGRAFDQFLIGVRSLKV